MSLEEFLVKSDVLDGDDAPPRIELEHSIHQQKGVTVRKPLHDLLNVEPGHEDGVLTRLILRWFRWRRR